MVVQVNHHFLGRRVEVVGLVKDRVLLIALLVLLLSLLNTVGVLPLEEPL